MAGEKVTSILYKAHVTSHDFTLAMQGEASVLAGTFSIGSDTARTESQMGYPRFLAFFGKTGCNVLKRECQSLAFLNFLAIVDLYQILKAILKQCFVGISLVK